VADFLVTDERRAVLIRADATGFNAVASDRHNE